MLGPPDTKLLIRKSSLFSDHHRKHQMIFLEYSILRKVTTMESSADRHVTSGKVVWTRCSEWSQQQLLNRLPASTYLYALGTYLPDLSCVTLASCMYTVRLVHKISMVGGGGHSVIRKQPFNNVSYILQLGNGFKYHCLSRSTSV